MISRYHGRRPRRIQKNARRQVQAATSRTFEALEERRLFALLGVGSQLGYPEVAFDNTSATNYSASTNAFDVTALPTDILFSASGPDPLVSNGVTPRNFEIHLRVDHSGNLIGGVNPGDAVVKGSNDAAGDDVRVLGKFTDPNTHVTTDGVLLTGEVVQFGWLSSHTTGTGNDRFDFRFVVTGGSLASYFSGQNIGASLVSNSSTFVGNFNVNFAGTAEGNLAPIPRLTPTIATTAIENNGNTVGSALLSDTVTVSGGYKPTGTVSFTLTAPDGTVTQQGSVLISGDGNYSSPTTVLATQVGTYTWHATYSGDAVNTPAEDNGANESQSTVKASPAIVTNASEIGSTVGTAVLSDSATLSGAYAPGGVITFTLTSPDGSTTTVGTVAVTANGTYPSPTVLATQVGTYTWHASYSGDGLNNGAIDDGANESVSTDQASPAINTVAGATVVIGSGAMLTDTAVLSGGFNPTGIITFTLTGPGNAIVDTETVPATGDGIYTTPAGYLPTVTGTYVWSATYSGDANNVSATDNGVNESEVVSPAGPAINTVAGNAVVIGSGALLTDTAVLSGGFNPTGTITFTLTGPGNAIVDTEVVAVSGDGSYSTPTGYLPTGTGTYLWTATYSGDSNNTSAQDNGQNESETVTSAHPAINTVAGSTVIIGSGNTLTDTAVLSGGYNPTGTITFTLTGPGNTVVDTETVTASGNGTYTTPTGYVPTLAGTYVWSATYSGDSNNVTATDNGQNESEVVSPASPAINTVAASAVVIGSGAKLTDTAYLSGAYNPTGTITFTLTGPGNAVVDTEVVTVSGNGTYTTPAGYLPTGVGTYVWSATYSGDSNNITATDNGQNESETVTAASPSIVTTPSSSTITLGTGTVTLKDSAVLSGGYNETGTITFTLYNGATLLDTEVVSVSGNGTYSTPAGYTLPTTGTVTGVYQWNATFTSADSNNLNAVDANNAWERVTVNAASPSISTTPSVTTDTTSAVGAGQFATIGFWHNPNGQAVINAFNGSSSSTLLGNWMATTWPHLFGQSNVYTAGVLSSLGKTTLAGLTNAQVAQVYMGLWTPSGVAKNTYVQAFAVALGLYADTASLGGQSLINNGMASQYGFVVTNSGAGVFNVGTNGAAFGVPNNTLLPVSTILSGADAAFSPSTGLFYAGDATRTGALNNVLNGINTTGDIPGTGAGIIQLNDGSKITDAATLVGGYYETGTITFTLYGPDGVTVVDTETAAVHGDGTYYTPVGYTATATGTYNWVATYSGDGNNNTVAGNFGDEPVTVGAAATPASLGDFVWFDYNHNGIQDAGEPGVSNVTVKLLDASGNVLSTTTTDSGGYYHFTNLTPTAYKLQFVAPAGYTFTVKDAGSNNAVDSDADSAGNTGLIVLSSGQTDNTWDAGLYTSSAPSILSGFVYDDCNGNGVKDSSEAGIGGATLTLTGTPTGSSTPITLVTTTDSNGLYYFCVPAGTYSISETQPAGYVDGKDTVGTINGKAVGTLGTDAVNSIALPAGAAGINYNFGEFDVATISGLVFADANNDGQVQLGDAGIANVKVTLTGKDILGTAVNVTTYTDSAGAYVFGNLRPSDANGYAITETQPAGYNDGKDVLGTINGVTVGSVSNDKFSGIKITCGDDALNYNFAEVPQSGTKVGTGMTATIGFWQNKNGQALITSLNGSSNSTALGNWLAGNFPSLFGNMAGYTNSKVAAAFTQYFKQTGMKLQAQALAAAFAVYCTNTTLAGGAYASSYGFKVGSSGTGSATYNVGSDGAAAGLTNNTSYSIIYLLQTASSKNIFASTTPSSMQTAWNNIFNNINQSGDII